MSELWAHRNCIVAMAASLVKSREGTFKHLWSGMRASPSGDTISPEKNWRLYIFKRHPLPIWMYVSHLTLISVYMYIIPIPAQQSAVCSSHRCVSNNYVAGNHFKMVSIRTVKEQVKQETEGCLPVGTDYHQYLHFQWQG